jgi:hypothetical protein
MDASPDSLSQIATTVSQSSAEGVLGVMIPIIAIIMGIGIGMLSMWLDYRKKRDIFELHHKERMAAIDKGMEVPPLPPELFQGNKRPHGRLAGDYLRRGLVWTFIGIGIVVAMLMERERGAWYGLIAVGAGLANLLMYAYQSRQPPEPTTQDATIR